MGCWNPETDAVAAEKLALLRERFAGAFGADGDAGAPVGGPAVAASAGAARGPFVLASAPGRVEVAGNHVDHQGGRTISAAIGERTWGLAAENGLARIRVAMAGFGTAEIDLTAPDWAEPQPEEALTSAALVRGMAAAFERAGGAVRGFDLVTDSDVPSGCGLSSSAAFEVMVGACVEALFGPGPFADSDAPTAAAAPAAPTAAPVVPTPPSAPAAPVPVLATASPVGATSWSPSSTAGDTPVAIPLDPVRLALAATAVEQRYFGKPCGAQDQMACACGDVITIDFAPAVPVAEAVPLDAAAAGYAALLVDSRQDHSLHQDEFAAIPADMYAVARALGASRLGDVPVEALLAALPRLRAELGDGRVMRALHYYDEVARVGAQRTALAAGDFEAFLQQVRLSGMSSAQFLQNVSVRGAGEEECQPAMVIQALCAHLLGERGAWRIHGGGFGGAVLVFVPVDEARAFAAAMDDLLGYAACRSVTVGEPGVRAVRLP